LERHEFVENQGKETARILRAACTSTECPKVTEKNFRVHHSIFNIRYSPAISNIKHPDPQALSSPIGPGDSMCGWKRSDKIVKV